MRIATSPESACSAPASASVNTIALRRPSAWTVRAIRTAISPRLAMRTTGPSMRAVRIRSGAERAGDDHLLDLVGPLADREDLRVAVEAADGVLLDVAIAPVDLHGLLGGADREAARLELGLRGGEGEAPPLVL